MIDLVRKAMLAGVGAQEKVKEVVDELVTKGKMSQSEGAKLVKDVMEKMEKGGSELEQKITSAVQKAVEKIGLPSRKDLESLERQLQELNARVKKMEERK